MSEITVILVGERFNRKPETRVASWWPRIYEDPEKYWRVQTALRCFQPSCQRRLRDQLGLRWDVSLNLLHPSHTCSDWEPILAREAARIVRAKAAELYERPLIVCCGTRVATAFGVYKLRAGTIAHTVASYELRLSDEVTKTATRHVRLTRVPHPSGLNRMWNCPETISAIHQTYAESLVAAYAESPQEAPG